MATAVGFAGLGNMGQAMARRLLDAGFDVSVYNRTLEKAEALLAAGARSARRRRGAASRATAWS